MGHELIHALSYVTGTYKDISVEYHSDQLGMNVEIKMSEALAVGLRYFKNGEWYEIENNRITENSFRSEGGYNERATYGSVLK